MMSPNTENAGSIPDRGKPSWNEDNQRELLIVVGTGDYDVPDSAQVQSSASEVGAPSISDHPEVDAVSLSVFVRPKGVLPAIKPNQEARQHIAGPMAKIASGLQSLIWATAMESGVKLNRIDVEIRRFREDRGHEMKFKISTELNSEQAFAFWDALGTRLEEWSGRLSGLARRLIDEDTAISVNWVE